ncbi:hypothetical protein Tco_1381920, partial [Tanacetum coccineum]
HDSFIKVEIIKKTHKISPNDDVGVGNDEEGDVDIDEKRNGPLKDDKRKVTGIKILDYLEQRIENVKKDLNKIKEKMDLNKGKEKMVMKKGNTSFEQIP